MEFQLSYSKSWKMMLWKCCTQYASKFGRLSSGHRLEKVSFHCQRKGVPKNVQTTAQLHSSHMLAKYCSKFSKLGFNSTWTKLPDVQAGFRKGRGSRDQVAKIFWILEKARNFQNSIYFCFIDFAKAFDSVDHNKLWKILQDMGIPTTWTASWEICMQIRNQQLELDMEQQTGSKLGKEYVTTV